MLSQFENVFKTRIDPNEKYSDQNITTKLSFNFSLIGVIRFSGKIYHASWMFLVTKLRENRIPLSLSLTGKHVFTEFIDHKFSKYIKQLLIFVFQDSYSVHRMEKTGDYIRDVKVITGNL